LFTSSAGEASPGCVIRRASADDAPGIAGVLRRVASERVYSAIEQAWSVEQQRRYMTALSPREAIHVAVSAAGEVVGYQTVELYSAILTSMAHVGGLGTFLQPAWRRRGVGAALFEQSAAFARSAAYRKFVIQVRASNGGARAFYAQLGFAECGRLARQVVIDGREDDEIMMERFL
jgi:ribosomal protein S18 acetylase RimI-like enzyme